MTSTDGCVPDLTELDQGDDVEVFYRSQRTGNEVDREGTVSSCDDVGEGRTLVSVHTERKSALKRVYVRLIDATTEGGDDVVAAYSITVEADHDLDDPPLIGRTYTLTYEVERASLLGVVDHIRVNDGPLFTDGQLLGRP